MYEYKVLEVIKVIDGDTIDLQIDLGFGMSARLRCRVYDVDTPEVYGPNQEPAGPIASQFTKEWLNDRELLLKTYKGSQESTGIGDGAFGRWLGSLIDINTNEYLSDALIAEGLSK